MLLFFRIGIHFSDNIMSKCTCATKVRSRVLYYLCSHRVGVATNMLVLEFN